MLINKCIKGEVHSKIDTFLIFTNGKLVQQSVTHQNFSFQCASKLSDILVQSPPSWGNLAVRWCTRDVKELSLKFGRKSKWSCTKKHGQENTSRNKEATRRNNKCIQIFHTDPPNFNNYRRSVAYTVAFIHLMKAFDLLAGTAFSRSSPKSVVRLGSSASSDPSMRTWRALWWLDIWLLTSEVAWSRAVFWPWLWSASSLPFSWSMSLDLQWKASTSAPGQTGSSSSSPD